MNFAIIRNGYCDFIAIPLSSADIAMKIPKVYPVLVWLWYRWSTVWARVRQLVVFQLSISCCQTGFFLFWFWSYSFRRVHSLNHCQCITRLVCLADWSNNSKKKTEQFSLQHKCNIQLNFTVNWCPDGLIGWNWLSASVKVAPLDGLAIWDSVLQISLSFEWRVLPLGWLAA